ncbi:hypothetical protein V9T40_012096 [Parthenolecanium corni]|uniref:HTH CENPB-type domain-containing protein n=1 Tax=Parthenolecanium corni TaxID=536013 RepID=A0AAN9T776_9HEMI
MPRRKPLELFDENTMKDAVFKVVHYGCSIRGAARDTNLSYATLRKYVAKYKSTEAKKKDSIRFYPNYEVNQVYSKELEDTLEKYLLAARKLHYGLTSETIKRMSYDLAIKNNLKVPKSWKENRMAGKHWLYGYLRRHPAISEILSWSRKFRPPIKNQFNTTKEIATPSVEEITLTEKDLENFVTEESRSIADEAVVVYSKSSLVEPFSETLRSSTSDNSQPSCAQSVIQDSLPPYVESVMEDSVLLQSNPVIINVIKKSKKKT